MANRSRATVCAILAGDLPAAEPFTHWNGTFTEATETPAHRRKKGTATIARDTIVFRTGPASLRAEVASGIHCYPEIRGFNVCFKDAAALGQSGIPKPLASLHQWERFNQSGREMSRLGSRAASPLL